MTKLLSDIMVELHVPSFEVAKDFYRALGFKVVWERDPEPNMQAYMVMRRESSIINFYSGTEDVYKHPYFSRFPKETKRGYGVEIIIPVVGIEKFYKEISEKYKDKIMRPLNKKYGKPDFRMEDPFGYYLRFVEAHDWVHGRDKKGNKIKK